MINNIKIISIFLCFLININSFTQNVNGTYICNEYLYYNYDGSSEWTFENPEYTYHTYLINISISEIYGTGLITIKDMNTNTVVTHSISGKIKDIYIDDIEDYGFVYSGTLNVYGFSQIETIFIIINSRTNKLRAIVTNSPKFKSKGNYIDLKQVDDF